MNKLRSLFHLGLQKTKDVFKTISKETNNILTIKIIKSNILYVVCFVIYFMLSFYILGRTVSGFLLTLFIYFISIMVAISPVGEIIMRALNNIRDLYTKQEKAYLMPLFEEVYNEVEKKHKLMSQKIEIRIIDVMHIKVFAVGINTIAVTRGAIETLSKEQLKGLIANSFGHLINGDSIAEQIVKIGNGIFSLIVILISLVLLVIEMIMIVFKKSRMLGFVIAIFHFICIGLFFGLSILFYTIFTHSFYENLFCMP